MTIENSVSDDFLSTFVESIGVSDCYLPVLYCMEAFGLNNYQSLMCKLIFINI